MYNSELINEHQQKLQATVQDLMQTEAVTLEEQTYQSVISMTVQMIDEGRLDDLHAALQVRFPEYYTNPVRVPVLSLHTT